MLHCAIHVKGIRKKTVRLNVGGSVYATLRIDCKGLTSLRTAVVRGEKDPGAIDDDLSSVLEIDGDPRTDRRLHLAEAPVRTLGMPHQISGFQELFHAGLAGGCRVERLGMTTPDLSALVAARLCHDLISPMGAIRNGLELMQMSASPHGPGAEVELVTESLETALAKLRYYRLAFGPADPEVRQAFSEAVQVTDAMYSGRFSVTWNATGHDMPRPLARMIYLTILCLEKSLPMGGLLQITVSGNEVGLSVEGRRMVPPPGLWAHVLKGEPLPDLRADSVQFGLLRKVLDGTHMRLAATFTETGALLDIASVSPLPA